MKHTPIEKPHFTMRDLLEGEDELRNMINEIGEIKC
jgi:hypothetical protein